MSEPPRRPTSPDRARRLAFYASGALPLLGLCGAPPDLMLLIYTTFVAASAIRRRTTFTERIPGPPWLSWFVIMVLVGFLTETLAWAGNYLARAEQPALFHPQLLYDLLLSPGIYAAWAVGWILGSRRWRFSVTDVFVVQGVYGILLEQNGAILLAGLRAMPLGLRLRLYVFVVDGAAAGLAYLPFESRLAAPRATDSRWKFPAALLALLAATALAALGWSATLDALGVTIPEPKPIWLAPLW